MTYTTDEAARNADFRACPILSDYIATMLEDLQFRETDEACSAGREALDTGTIYTLSEVEYQKAKSVCERFMVENAADIEAALELIPGEEGLRYARDGRYMTYERIGYYLYMTRVGHGVAFTDDSEPDGADCLRRLDESASSLPYFEPMVGEEGEVYS